MDQKEKNIVNTIEENIDMLKNISISKQEEIRNLLSNIMSSDNRVFERKKHDTLIDYVDKGGSYMDYIKNFSDGGIFIETGKSFPIGHEISMQFKPPGCDEEIKVSGKVVRKTPSGVGVKFDTDTASIAFFRGWLAAQNKHLATHSEKPFDEGGYCYTRPNGYDYTDKMAFPVSLKKAFEMGWVSLNKKSKKYEGHTDWAGLRYE